MFKHVKMGIKELLPINCSFQIKGYVTLVHSCASLKLAQKIRLLIRYICAYYAFVFYLLTNSYQLRLTTISNVQTNASDSFETIYVCVLSDCKRAGTTYCTYILIYIQRDATLHSLFISENCSTCFGWYFHHHQERKQLYLQHLVFVRPLLLSAAIGM
jgi:hypothetical protein